MKLSTLIYQFLISLGIPAMVAKGMAYAAQTEYERYQNKRDYYGRSETA